MLKKAAIFAESKSALRNSTLNNQKSKNGPSKKNEIS